MEKPELGSTLKLENRVMEFGRNVKRKITFYHPVIKSPEQEPILNSAK